MKNQRKLNKMALAAAVIGLTVAAAGTARADEWHGHEHGHGHAYGHEKHERQEWRAHERWEWRRDDWGTWHHVRFVEYVPYYVVEEPVVYQPPVQVYYPPAPVYYSPPPSGFNIVIPLTIK